MKFINHIFITILIALFLLLSFNNRSSAQLMERPSTTEIPQQSVYLELGGNALLYSVNYDVLFKNNFGLRLGGGYFFDANSNYLMRKSGLSNSSAFFGVIMGHYMHGEGSHKLETGVGLMIGTIYDSHEWNHPKPPGGTFSVGYRYYPEDSNRVSFKAAFTPTINRAGFHPGIGFSIGITLTPEGDASIPIRIE